jgi:glyoxylase-like metal-dependent hydrolase (beta-lactamase superfamily II)
LEITKGIHLIPRVRGANAYLLQGEGGITIVDTGLPGNADRILDYVESIGWHRSDVKTIVLTHPDMDHAGSAARLREETHAKVAIHEADAPRLSGEKELKNVRGSFKSMDPRDKRMARLFLRVIGAFNRFERLKADVLLRDSDIIDGLTVIHTPGHTEGSICLYLLGRALFVGDALATDSKRMLSLPRQSMSMDLNLARESVRKISQLEFSTLLPGHGPPIERNASTVIVSKINARDDALKIIRLVEQSLEVVFCRSGYSSGELGKK